MKASNYNFFFPYESDESKVIAYNSLSNALALMDKDKHKVFNDFLNHNHSIDDDEFLQQLKFGNFIVESECNELEFLRHRMLSNRYQTRTLSLTIATTADCNFRCPYCYEKDVIKPIHMSVDIQDKIIELVKSQSGTISNLSVVWYGGEPLMALDVIERLSRVFIEICEENKITYFANIITNGYLLNSKTANLLAELKVQAMQITIDGNEEHHNTQRPYFDGSATFDTIIRNLVENKDILPPTSIRINVDKDNIKQADEVFRILHKKNLLDKMKPYLGKINPDNNTYEGSKCFDMCGFSEADLEYFSKFVNELGCQHRYPQSVSNACTADATNSFVIGADGLLYKCWINIGDKASAVGDIMGVVHGNQKLFFDYLMFDATNDSECRHCKFIPICMGGCPYRRVSGQETCTLHKYFMEKVMNTISQKIKSDVTTQKGA